MNVAELRELPKVELHNHLDGGLRVDTILDLADAAGYDGLPTTDPEALAAWFDQGQSGSLERYLAAFTHTLAVLQTAGAVERVAYEAVVDLADDGVIYGEIRFAPVLCTRQGLRREDVIEAALAGFARGRDDTGVRVNLIVDAMRELPDSMAEARAAVRFADQGVVGFDLAGPEQGFPASAHTEAVRHAAAHGLHITIHAGEGAGWESIADTLECCLPERIGHGVHIVDALDSDDPAAHAVVSRLLDGNIPLEVCPTSNLHTMGVGPADHPVGRLYRAGFNVTLNTDNRLMSRVTLTDEFALAANHQGFDVADLGQVTRAAVEAAFADAALKDELRGRVATVYLK
jgi:adenosine deaminase